MVEAEPITNGRPRFRRILLKLSGEAMAPAQGNGIDLDALGEIAKEVKEVADLGIELAVVIGAGNILRGSEYEARGMDRSTADQMGMLATVINALAMQNALEQMGVPTRVLSAIEMHSVCEPYILRRAVRHLEKGRVVLFAAGTGNPYFTTDTTAALRAAEIGAEAILKGTHSGVDGVSPADPLQYPDAVKLPEVSHFEVLNRRLAVMDSTAITFCMDNGLPIIVFDVMQPGNIGRALVGEPIGTLVSTAT